MRPNAPNRSDAEKVEFLRVDFYDTLRWMFVGAITWQAAPTKASCPNLDAVGMYASLVQSRNLYEFYYDKNDHRPDDARAWEFAPNWIPEMDDPSAIYKKYLGQSSPINKRISHLVWERNNPKHSGGTLADGSDELKNQVLPCANDVVEITNKFIALITPGPVQTAALLALADAHEQARATAKDYGIDNPFEVPPAV